jgi:hypothetical protein
MAGSSPDALGDILVLEAVFKRSYEGLYTGRTRKERYRS